MDDIISIREKINQMAEHVLSMLVSTFDGFMKHDLDKLSSVIEEENKLNDMERSLSFSLIQVSKEKSKAVDNRDITLLVEIIADLEEIGDYIKDMIERIEIKIEEKLLFSEDALSEYKHLYNVVEAELVDVEKALKMNDKSFANRILCSQEQVDQLVAKYREAHAKRLVAGICLPRACNMFLDLLDFTAQISRHTKTVAKNILELK